jgi:hypothetical protein
VIRLDEEAEATDLNQDGQLQPWEVNRLIQAEFNNGDPIRDTQMYRLATLDYLVKGGDDLGWIMNQIPKNRIHLTAGPTTRDAIREHMEKIQLIHSLENPLIKADEPRS